MSLTGSGTYQIILLLLPPFWFPCRVLLPLFLVRLFWFLSRLLFPCRVLFMLRLFWFPCRALFPAPLVSVSSGLPPSAQELSSSPAPQLLECDPVWVCPPSVPLLQLDCDPELWLGDCDPEL